MSLCTGEDALELLRSLGASERLVRHHELVLEAADALLDGLDAAAHGIDVELVRMGAAVHDAGKVVHPEEMDGPGSEHEVDGGPLLMRAGAEKLARFCETHARWRGRELPLEDLLVALADVLWKGRRNRELEERVVVALAERRGVDLWDVLVAADDVFERVADGGEERLARS